MPKATTLDRETTTSITANSNPPESFVPHRYRLTVAEYHRLGEMAIFDEDSRVELIEGDLIAMPPE
jgi:Uma2 family endonuclease